ncbi:hypothetical protein TNCV_4230131 [Trichonephila clavipes]|uniref:RNase H type-1 domain-containing protein n=1 Tax=Trichonephila clavipes TaxID=2585209 RepID=A0A8X6VL95_TRICX|nr:hypothetical protein TNCV_4230131 [Trichonephila clavipes]
MMPTWLYLPYFAKFPLKPSIIRRALQHFSGWFSANDETIVTILLKQRENSQIKNVHLQWIPSHVNSRGKEVADRLAKEGSENGNGYRPISNLPKMVIK